MSSKISSNKSSFLKKLYNRNPYIVHISLFLLTFLSTTICGSQWAAKDFTDVLNWKYGLTYSILILTFLTAHEFGHYIASRIHKVDATLPFYIPSPIPWINFFGTFGAVIRTRTPIPSRKALFDIGVAGPIAGFIVSCIFLAYGLMTLPSIDFINNLNAEMLAKYSPNEIIDLHFGDTLLYYIMSKFLANPHGFLPPMNEIYHYPFLNVGWFGIFVTSLNMLPIGQLDGGHVTYSMFGAAQNKIARVFWWLMIVLGIGSLFGSLHEQLLIDYPYSWYIFIQTIFLPPLNWIQSTIPWYYHGWEGWLFWAFITRIFIKINHPPIPDTEPLDRKRMAVGWFALLILLLSFSYNGIYIIE